MNAKCTIFGLGLMAASLGGCSRPTTMPTGRWIDLTHPYDEHTIYWPTADGFKLDAEFAGKTDKGYYYHANHYAASEHGGTHADAPIHFTQNGRRLDDIPVDAFCGPAVVVDVSSRTLQNPDYLVSVADLTGWEARHGRIPDGAILLVRTGYDRFWPDRSKYLGTVLRGQEGVANLHFPGLEPPAARWLVAERKIKVFGIDTASIDYGQSKLFEVHQVLFAADIPALENVARLGELPPVGAYLIAMPMKITGGTGAPVRVAGVVR